MRKACFLFFLFFFLFAFRPALSLADTSSSNFITDYTVIYTAQDNGLTHVYMQVSLTNKTSTYYASSYKMDLGFSDIENLKAADPGGPTSIAETKTDTGKSLALAFNKKVIGKGNTLTFSVNFDTTDVTHIYGRVREIDIPGISTPDDFNTFNVQVHVPADFGSPSYVKPETYQQGLLFTKTELKKSGISIAYGSGQSYKFNLTYHLQNTNLFPKDMQIAVPPTTNYQTVSLTDMSPRPKNITLDKDGNWLATYSMLPSESLTVTVSGTADISLTPSTQPLSQKDFALYTADQPYWQVNDPAIRSLALRLKTPEAIYNYVVNTLHYDFSRVTNDEPRLGAVQALNDPSSAVCLEFTDTFIALARAAGIPAREIDGYAETENTKLRPLSLAKDILHAWPEYYDPSREAWIMVDPTWGSTTGGVDYFNTLDFDHLAFVIRGVASDYPIPAGGYQSAETPGKKDVQVTFGEAPTNVSVQQFQLDTKLPSPYLAGTSIKGTVIVKNVGPQLTDPQQITVLSKELFPPEQEVPVPKIPPFGLASVPFTFARTGFLTNHEYTYTIRLGQSTINRSVSVSPFVVTTWRFIIGGLIFVILAVIISFIAFKSRRIRLP